MAERRVGPRKTCPKCGTRDVSEPTYCSPGSRVFIGAGLEGTFMRLIKGSPLFCTKEGKHLHQHCSVCKCTWTGTPVDAQK